MNATLTLTRGWELHHDNMGNPFLLGPSRRPHDVGDNFLAHEWWPIADQWLRSPDNDCLRARGDLRWTAVNTAELRWRDAGLAAKQLATTS